MSRVSGDIFRRVSIGERLSIPAPTWNAMLAVAEAYERGQIARISAGRTTREPDTSTVISVYNSTANPVPQFGILSITEPMIEPGQNEPGFRASRLMKGEDPTGTAVGTAYAVMQEPVDSKAIGKAVILGLTPARLRVMSLADTFADPSGVVGEGTKLFVSGAGTAKIVWFDKVDNIGDEVWALLLLLSASSSTAYDIYGHRQPAWHPMSMIGQAVNDSSNPNTTPYGWTFSNENTSKVILVPFVLPRSARCIGVGCSVFASIPPTDTYHWRLGLYKADSEPAAVWAGELLAEGEVTASWGDGGLTPTVSCDVVLSSGLYWIAIGIPTDGLSTVTGGFPNSGVAFSFLYNVNNTSIYSPTTFLVPSPVGAATAGAIALSSAYKIAYPNAASRTSSSGTLPNPATAPTIATDYYQSIAIPLLSLDLSEVF